MNVRDALLDAYLDVGERRLDSTGLRARLREKLQDLTNGGDVRSSTPWRPVGYCSSVVRRRFDSSMRSRFPSYDIVSPPAVPSGGYTWYP